EGPPPRRRGRALRRARLSRHEDPRHRRPRQGQRRRRELPLRLEEGALPRGAPRPVRRDPREPCGARRHALAERAGPSRPPRARGARHGVLAGRHGTARCRDAPGEAHGMNRRTGLVIVAVVLVAATAAWFARRDQGPAHYTGFVEGEERVLRSEVTGRVLEVAFPEGAAIPPNAAGARLDAEDIQARIASKQHELAVLDADTRTQEERITLV